MQETCRFAAEMLQTVTMHHLSLARESLLYIGGRRRSCSSCY